MPELYTNGTSNNFLVIPAQYGYISNALSSSTSSSSYHAKVAGIAKLNDALNSTFTSKSLDCVIYPQQKNLVVPVGSSSQAGRNGILAALTGSPVITMPIGFSEPSEHAPVGVPIGMEILGMPFSEALLLQIAQGIDTRIHARQAPVTGGLNEVIEVTQIYDAVPSVTPLKNLPTQYPLGTY
jgi:hypothetical protein